MKKNTKYTFISIATLVLIIILGIVVAINKRNKIVIPSENNETLGVVEPERTGVNIAKNDVRADEQPSANSKEKFDIAMKNGSNSFVAGDINSSIRYYTEALSYRNIDTAHYRLFTVYASQKNWDKAINSINNAIKINPEMDEYWKSKIFVLDEGFKASFSELNEVFREGFEKTKASTKINLVTYFATLSANKGEKSSAIQLWQQAIELNSSNKDAYQAEIDALK